MEEYIISRDQIAEFGRFLQAEEREPETVEKYCRDVRAFAAWLDGRSVTKERAVE